jgi:lipopolysaccharide/colanic/teichoic acid biosynthesis glycosyltransferase
MTPAPSGGALPWRAAFAKRAFDLLVSAVGLALFSGPIAVCWVLARIDTGRGFFVQERIGREGRPFRIVKISTMRMSSSVSTTTTRADDPRITPLGRRLRRMKLDELPQLYNVLRGDMSVVGPRPDVAGFADLLTGEDRLVLAVRPGITGPASLRFRDEEELLCAQSDPERFNREVLFPEKVRINKEYVRNYRFVDDLRYIVATLFPSSR